MSRTEGIIHGAFLIWEGLRLNVVEKWPRGRASLPALGAGRAGAAVPPTGLVVLGLTAGGINSHV